MPFKDLSKRIGNVVGSVIYNPLSPMGKEVVTHTTVRGVLIIKRVRHDRQGKVIRRRWYVGGQPFNSRVEAYEEIRRRVGIKDNQIKRGLMKRRSNKQLNRKIYRRRFYK